MNRFVLFAVATLVSGCSLGVDKTQPCITRPIMDVIAVGDSARLEAGFMDNLVSACIPATNTDFVWRSTNYDVISIDHSGMIYGIKPGTAVITASHGGYEGGRCIRVLPPVGTIEISPATAQIHVGDTLAFKIIVRDTSGEEIPNAGLSITSSEYTVAQPASKTSIQAERPGKTLVSTVGLFNKGAEALVEVKQR